MPTVQNIINTARTYMDEPDQTFLTDTIMTSLMGIAYSHFRQKVMECDPNILAKRMDIPVAGNSVDLSTIPVTATTGPILAGGGAAVVAAGDRMVKLLSVYTTDTTTGLPSTMCVGAGNLEAVANGDPLYYLEGVTLWLSRQVTGNLRLLYVPDAENITWTTATTVPPDDLDPVHDLIALYAFRQYQMMDSAVSQALMLQIEYRERALESYLMTRSVGGPDYVQNVGV